MIAANYRKHPEAMALQLVLHFGRLLVWALPRPTTRILRAIRAARGNAFKAAGRIAYPVRKTTPSWARAMAKKVRELGKLVKAAQTVFNFEEPRKLNGYTANIAKHHAMRPLARYPFNMAVC